MPYNSGAPLPDHEFDQVINSRYRPRPDPSLAPASEEAADRVRAGWAPLLTGQAVPRIGERVTPDADDPVRYPE